MFCQTYIQYYTGFIRIVKYLYMFYIVTNQILIIENTQGRVSQNRIYGKVNVDSYANMDYINYIGYD